MRRGRKTFLTLALAMLVAGGAAATWHKEIRMLVFDEEEVCYDPCGTGMTCWLAKRDRRQTKAKNANLTPGIMPPFAIRAVLEGDRAGWHGLIHKACLF